jgi:putative ABC transport system permease protein
VTTAEAERRYRRLIRLLPSALVEEAGTDLLEVFAEDFRRLDARSRLAQVRFWIRILGDTVLTAVAERWPRGRRAREAGQAGGAMTVSMVGQSVLGDLRHAVHVLRRMPGYGLAAIATLTIGIGANTAMFSVIGGVLLRPLPYVEPARLMKITGLGTRTPGRPVNLSLPDFLDLSRQTTAFDRLGAHSAAIGAVTVVDPDGAERVRAVAVTAGFFESLGATPALGRLTRPVDDETGASVVVISDGYWRRAFARDPSVLGRTLTLGTAGFTVVGVLPAEFRYPQPDLLGDPDLYAPIPLTPPGARSARSLRAIGRLHAGTSPEAAQADATGIAANLARTYPTDDAGTGLTVTPLFATIVGDTARPLWLCLAFALCVLAMACVNVANLSLAKAIGRRKEMALRTALGARRGRLVQQVLTESLFLSSVGCLCAWAVGSLLVRVLVVVGHASLPRVADIHLDSASLIGSAVLSVVAGLLTGLGPALRSARTDLVGTLQTGDRGSDAAPSGAGRQVLIGVEAMLSAMLLIGAALVGRTFWNLVRVDPGFAVAHTLTAQLSIPSGRYPAATWPAFFDELYGRIARLPGVEGVAATSILPLSGSHSCDSIRIEAHPVLTGRDPCAEMRTVSAGYFSVMGVPVVRGRAFTAADREGAPAVVVVNQAMGAKFWPGENPVGQRLTLTSLGPTETPREVVGVVGDTAHLALAEPPVPQYYVPQHQPPGQQLMTLVVRSAERPDVLAPLVRAQLAEQDRRIPLYNVRTLDDLVSAAVALPRFQTLVLGLFAGVAWLLALVGIYGVLAETVGQRVREIGVRLCLGATRLDVAWLMIRQVMGPVTAGLGAGVLLSVGVVRWTAATLYGIASLDPVIILGVPVVLALATLVAAYGPVRRATRVAPALALRGE